MLVPSNTMFGSILVNCVITSKYKGAIYQGWSQLHWKVINQITITLQNLSIKLNYNYPHFCNAIK